MSRTKRRIKKSLKLTPRLEILLSRDNSLGVSCLHHSHNAYKKYFKRYLSKKYRRYVNKKITSDDFDSLYTNEKIRGIFTKSFNIDEKILLTLKLKLDIL